MYRSIIKIIHVLKYVIDNDNVILYYTLYLHPSKYQLVKKVKVDFVSCIFIFLYYLYKLLISILHRRQCYY